MQLTRSVSYAIGILLNVERARSAGPVTATKIARRDQFPPRFLYRVLRRLVDAGILTGVSGPGGGYALARPAKKISLAEIVEAVEGPQEATVLEPVAAFHAPAIKRINLLCEQNAAAFRRALKSTSLAQLGAARRSPQGRRPTKRKR
ncbi:MAG: Rrf2 family transcriptional regulator [Planctomycetaceae bacterium]|nr:Rrf2 family transcriptional regulator [Planctomycetaceae bacterium]